MLNRVSNNKLLLVILSLLALLLRIGKIEHNLGTKLCFSSICILIIYSLYGIKRSVIVSLFVYSISIVFGNSYLDIYIILEVLTIGLIDKYKPEWNLIFKDILFWVLIGSPIRIILSEIGLVDFNGDYVLFILLRETTNPVFNVLIADLIVTYIPLKRWLGLKQNVYFKNVMFHIVIITIFCPFAFNFMIRSQISNDLIANTNTIIELSKNASIVNQQIGNGLYKESVLQFRFLVFFSVITLVIVLMLYKKVFLKIHILIEIATKIKLDVGIIENVKWPDTNIKEIELLVDNIKEIALNLKKQLEESKNLNNELEQRSKELMESKEKLHKRAYYDILTELPNRLSFMEAIEDLKNIKDDVKIALLYFDIDHFKNINDTLGHNIGDEILIAVANRVRSIMCNNTFIYRLGGDEFIAIVKVKERREAEEIGKNILKLMDNEFKVDDKELFITISVGISMYPDDSNNIDEVVRYSDIAMYKAKQYGGNSMEYFSEGIKQDFLDRDK